MKLHTRFGNLIKVVPDIIEVPLFEVLYGLCFNSGTEVTVRASTGFRIVSGLGIPYFSYVFDIGDDPTGQNARLALKRVRSTTWAGPPVLFVLDEALITENMVTANTFNRLIWVTVTDVTHKYVLS